MIIIIIVKDKINSVNLKENEGEGGTGKKPKTKLIALSR